MEKREIPTLKELAHQIALAHLRGAFERHARLSSLAYRLYPDENIIVATLRAMRQIEQEQRALLAARVAALEEEEEEELLGQLLEEVDLSGLDELAA